MPRSLIVGFAVLFYGCNEIRYQASRIDKEKLGFQKSAVIPDRRATFTCRDGEPFDVYFPPGGAGAVLSMGGDDFALRDLTPVAGERYGDGRYELVIEEDGDAYVTVDEKRVRDRCKRQ